jgi:hypothetical protein
VDRNARLAPEQPSDVGAEELCGEGRVISTVSRRERGRTKAALSNGQREYLARLDFCAQACKALSRPFFGLAS